MSARMDSRELAERTAAPSSSEVREAAVDYMGRADMTHSEMGQRIGYGKSSVDLWMQGRYPSGTDAYIRAAIWDYMERHRLTPRASAKGRLFETENYRQIRRLFERATEHGELVLLYGPPGTQKSFTLEHLICAQNRDKKQNAVYVYASAQMRPTVLLKRIGRELGVPIGRSLREPVLNNILAALGQCERPPAIVVDEAQHLDVACLETLRELHDRSGCGLVLAGSHNLYLCFTRPERRAHLEQWLSRIDHRDQLPGLQRDELREIAAHELGNGHPAKLSEKFVNELAKQCRVEDIFSGENSRSYLSVRRLVKLLAQYKAKKEGSHGG